MREDVSKADDLGVIAQDCGDCFVFGGDDVGRLADDQKLTFDCGSSHPVALELLE